MQQLKHIGTHSGHFHCDEVLACSMLINHSSIFKGAKITRSRDQKVLDQLDLVCDVGGIYDPSKHRYDHHQKEFQETFDEKHKIRLSSAGLIYKHFGRDILKNAIPETLNGYKLKIDPPTVDEKTAELIYQRLYDNFIQSIDAVDNGVNQYENPGEARYSINTGLGYVVSRLNPMWTEEAEENERFNYAMQVVNTEFLSQIRGLYLAWLPARRYVEEAIERRNEVDPSGEIIKLEVSVPWKSHLYDIEEELKIEGKIKFVLYRDLNEGWRVQGINLSEGFDLRKALKQEWRGIKDGQQLIQATGIEDVVFVHASGFIGGARSYESTLRMARESLA